MDQMTCNFAAGDLRARRLDLWCARWLTLLAALLVLFLLAGCRPHPRPPGPGDSTVVTPPDSIADSTATDTSQADTAVSSTGDTTGMESDDTTCMTCGHEVTPLDTLPQDSTDQSLRQAVQGQLASWPPDPELPTAPVGLPLGLNHYPMDSWCGGMFSATVETAAAKYVGGVLRRANDCGMQATLAPLRRLMQVSDRDAHFSPANYNAQMDAYARVLPPDTAAKYGLALFALDEPQCADCWNGRAISASEVTAAMRYTRQKFPTATIVVRSSPQVIATLYPQAVQYIDAGVVTWNLIRCAHRPCTASDEQAYFDKQAAFAQKAGLRVQMTVNVEDGSGTKTDPLTPSQVVTFGTVMASHPANCTSVSWQFNPDTWKKTGYQQAWAQVVNVARNHAPTSCRR